MVDDLQNITRNDAAAAVLRGSVMVLNRRIGERVFVGGDGTPVEVGGERGWRSWRAARVVDESFGDRRRPVRATFPRVRVDDLMIIGVDNARAVVDVRSVSATDDPKLSYYRVEFVSMGPAYPGPIS